MAAAQSEDLELAELQFRGKRSFKQPIKTRRRGNVVFIL